MPTEQETRADYFDSIYHSAVVFGINTSAMIEAGIIGKAVHTITVPQFAASQGGVLHFRYLREVGGGLVQVSETLEENARRLGDVVAGRDTEGEEAARRFTELFVRPNGVQVPATPVFVDAIEELAERGPSERLRTAAGSCSSDRRSRCSRCRTSCAGCGSSPSSSCGGSPPGRVCRSARSCR